MKIAVLDIETTGLSPDRDCIVEIGIVELNLDNGRLAPLFNKVVKSDGHIYNPDSWVFKNTNLKYDDVINAQLIGNYIEWLQNIFDMYSVTAYNSKFDFSFIEEAGIRIHNVLPCPMIVSTPILKLSPTRPGTQYKYPKVEEAWKYYFPDVEYIEKHRAYDDACHEAKIIYEMYKRGDYTIDE